MGNDSATAGGVVLDDYHVIEAKIRDVLESAHTGLLLASK